MKDFTVHFVNPASTNVRTSAEDAEDAIEKAGESVHVQLCHQCARHLELGDAWEPTLVIDEETSEIAWDEGI